MFVCLDLIAVHTGILPNCGASHFSVLVQLKSPGWMVCMVIVSQIQIIVARFLKHFEVKAQFNHSSVRMGDLRGGL